MKTLIALSFFVAFAAAASLPLEELEGRITNGEIARRGQFPYQVGIRIHFGPQSSWCGGSIISNRWVVTAAHCTLGADGLTVYYGAFDIRNATEAGQQRIYVSKANIFVHEGYGKPENGMNYDISLFKLPIEIEFNELIQPATLPKKSETYSSYVGELVWASGWGLESDNATSTSQYLRYIQVPVMKRSSCSNFYFGTVSESMICISTKGKKSTCSGDSGGPLVYKDGKVNYLIGATSYGIRLGCMKGWPGVFTRISSYLDWIEQISGIANK